MQSTEDEALTERLRVFARGNQLHWGDEEAAAHLVDRLSGALAAERDRADAAEKSAREWEADHDEVLELHDKLADRLALVQEQLAEAWERGCDAQNDVDKHAWPLPPNPYRSEASA